MGDLLKAVEDRDQHLETLAAKIEDVISANADLSLSKVRLEMKAVELEELKDRLEEERTELISNISELRKYSEETCKNLIEVQKAHTNLNTKMEALQEEHKKSQNSQRLHDEDMLEQAETIKEQKVALNQMEQLLHGKTAEMSDFLIQAEKAKIEQAKSTETIQHLNETITNRDEKILELSSLLDESTVQSKLIELTNKITTLKVELDESNDAKTMLEQQLESSMVQCKGLQDDLQTKIDNKHEFEEKMTKLEQHSLEQEGI